MVRYYRVQYGGAGHRLDHHMLNFFKLSVAKYNHNLEQSCHGAMAETENTTRQKKTAGFPASNFLRK